ncbi:MAG: HAD family hydrolase, partial [Lachnospiraceae bacterium]|nr:HAD family hydrolase [Lachnospiraceae bacterium]
AGLYNVTMFRPGAIPWKEEEKCRVEKQLQEAGISGFRVVLEENCLQILSERATKEEGVRRICERLHISPKETAAAGDSLEDRKMLELCGKKNNRIFVS